MSPMRQPGKHVGIPRLQPWGGGQGGISRPGWAMCEAVRSVSIQRFGRLIGIASRETVDAVNYQLMLWLDYRDQP
ncbi:MAG: type II toxin-antitoxin system PemK/MazF family toxin [Acidimicrobiales bacterium]